MAICAGTGRQARLGDRGQLSGCMVQHGNPAEDEVSVFHDNPARLLKQFSAVADTNDRRIDAAQNRMDPAQAGNFLLLAATYRDVVENDLDHAVVQHLHANLGWKRACILALDHSLEAQCISRVYSLHTLGIKLGLPIRIGDSAVHSKQLFLGVSKQFTATGICQNEIALRIAYEYAVVGLLDKMAELGFTFLQLP